jgi:hypothetical protein
MPTAAEPRKKSYLRSSVGKNEEVVKQNALKQRFRRIVLVSEVQGQLARLCAGAGAGAAASASPQDEGEGAGVRSASHLHPPSLHPHRHSDSQLAGARIAGRARGRSQSLTSSPAALSRLWTAPAHGGAFDGGLSEDSEEESDNDDPRGSATSLASTFATSRATGADSRDSILREAGHEERARSRRHSEAIGFAALHLAAHLAAERLGQRQDSVTASDRPDRRFIETTQGGAFIEIASLSPTRRPSRSSKGSPGKDSPKRRPRSSLEYALRPIPAFEHKASAPSDASRPHPLDAPGGPSERAAPEQSFSDFAKAARPLDERLAIAIVSIGRVSSTVVRAARFAAKATTGLEVIILEPIGHARRTHGSMAQAVAAVAKGATERAERRGILANRARGGESFRIFATLALSDIEAAEETTVDNAAEAASSIVVVPCLPETASPTSSAARLGRSRVDVGKVVHCIQRVLGRMLGLAPCTMYTCALAAREEHAALHVCPVCLRKLLWVTIMSLESHYASQREAKTAHAPHTDELGAVASRGPLLPPAAAPRPVRPRSASVKPTISPIEGGRPRSAQPRPQALQALASTATGIAELQASITRTARPRPMSATRRRSAQM